MNDNLIKVRSENIKISARFKIHCDFCGYELTGNNIGNLTDKANDLGWKYDYENDRVICRNCQEERENEQ